MKASLWFSVMGIAAGACLATDAAQSATTQRQYTAGRYALDIGGNVAGWVDSVSDAQAGADVGTQVRTQ